MDVNIVHLFPIVIIFGILNYYLYNRYFTPKVHVKTTTTQPTNCGKLNINRQTPTYSTNDIICSTTSSILRDIQSLRNLLNLNGFDIQIKLLATQIENANNIFTTGIGKSGIIAKRMSASVSSIGYNVQYVHGCEWSHGDFGKLKLKNKNENNLVIVISSSGKTKELYDAMKYIQNERIAKSINGSEGLKQNTNTFGIFCTDEEDIIEHRKCDTWMGSVVDKIVYLGKQNKELIKCCPSRSIIVQESFINVILTILNDRNSQKTMNEFRISHPGGNIGRILKL